MVVHSSRRRVSARAAISYVYLLASGLNSRHYTCSSFLLTYRKAAHHTSIRFGHRHIHQGHQRYSTKPLSSTKLLEDNQIDASNKWSFVLANNVEDHQDQTTAEKDETIRNILVCGDGDLSYSAEIASELDTLGIELYATVLEDEATHNKGMQHENFAFAVCD